MILNGILGGLATLSFLLTLWQWLVARRFPLHRRSADLRIGANQSHFGDHAPNRSSCFQPPVTLLKPLMGRDAHTEGCLRSWFAQDYPGETQILFAIADAGDPAGAVVKKLIAEFPQRDAQLVVCPERLGASAKVSKLAQLEPHVKHEILVVSDADVLAPPDLLANAMAPLRDERIGLASCFYRLANPTTLAMRWEAIAVNTDFWSQVLQSRSLKPLDFALGAVMVTRRKQLAEIGGFRALGDYLADDYQLGQRITRRGYRIELCPVVVECWSSPMTWGAVWRHQLRWARAIRVCQPWPYFFSILSNATFWPLLWLLATLPHLLALNHSGSGRVTVVEVDASLPLVLALSLLAMRVLSASLLYQQLTRKGLGWAAPLLVPLKDLAQVGIWAGAFLGNQIEWRGERFRLGRDGILTQTGGGRTT